MCKNVKVIRVPNLKNLTMKQIMEFAERNSDVKSCLPEYEYDKNPNREWYWNIGKHHIFSNHRCYSEYLIRRQIQRIYNRSRERLREKLSNEHAAKSQVSTRNCQDNWGIKSNLEYSQLLLMIIFCTQW